MITGANGFIGSHLIRRLTKEEGIEVAGMVRETSDLFRLADGTYDLRYASLTDSLEEIVRGFDAVIHTAALSSDWGDYDSFYRVNVEGTVNFLRASVASGVRRFIHFSSTVIYGFGGNRLTGEDCLPSPFEHPYCLTKAQAEEECLRFRGQIHLGILRPSNVFGPDDLTTTFPLCAALRKGMPAFPAGGRYMTSPCYIENLVEATVRALRGEYPSGETFNISDGSDPTWKEFLELFAGELGVRPPRVALPTGPLFLAAGLLEKICVCCRTSTAPIITPYRIAQVASDYSFSIEKARKMLGYQPPVTTAEGVRRSVRWFIKNSEQ